MAFYGIRINVEKFKANQTQVEYLSRLLTMEGLKLDPGRNNALLNMKQQTDVEGVQRIQGLVNYLSTFQSNLTDVCEPLRQLQGYRMNLDTCSLCHAHLSA